MAQSRINEFLHAEHNLGGLTEVIKEKRPTYWIVSSFWPRRDDTEFMAY